MTIDCPKAAGAPQAPGTQIKAAYEEKAPHRLLAKVIEAQH
jgi:hypothetical protein